MATNEKPCTHDTQDSENASRSLISATGWYQSSWQWQTNEWPTSVDLKLCSIACFLLSLLTTREVKAGLRSTLAREDNICYILYKGVIHCQKVFFPAGFISKVTSEARCSSHGPGFSFPLDKQKGSTCLRDSGRTRVLPPHVHFPFSTWTPSQLKCTSRTWRDLGMRLLLFSGILPAGLDSGLCLRSLLSFT